MVAAGIKKNPLSGIRASRLTQLLPAIAGIFYEIVPRPVQHSAHLHGTGQNWKLRPALRVSVFFRKILFPEDRLCWLKVLYKTCFRGLLEHQNF